MIEISYTLYCEDGELLSEERRSDQVPRVGELVTFGARRSYEVVDVLWHLPAAHDQHVTVSAYELDWHRHIAKILAERRGRNGGA
jgi:hypothetical protein